MPTREKIKELKDDKVLELEDKNLTHLRKNELQDALNVVAKYTIYTIPVIGLVFVILLSAHYISTNNWDAFLGIGTTVFQIGGGYLIRYLQELGIKSIGKN